jgi:hypothetical protein
LVVANEGNKTRLVLHVGAHKTGTSLVQKFFRDNPSFADKHNIDYIPRSDCNELIGWGKVPLRDPELLRDRLRFERRTKPGQLILISHENSLGKPFIPGDLGLYPETLRCARGLKKATRAFDTQVVFYMRPLADFVESYYLQTIHEGRTHSVEEWLEGQDPSSWSWVPVLEALDEVFGPESVSIGDFSEIANGQEDFLRLFLQRIGVTKASGLSYKSVRNASISARGLAMAMDVNQMLKTGDERHETRKFIQKHWSNRQFERARPLPADLRAQLQGQDDPVVAARAKADLDRFGEVHV